MPIEARWVRPAGVDAERRRRRIPATRMRRDRPPGSLGFSRTRRCARPVDLHDPELRDLAVGHGRHRDADLGPAADVELDELAVVHAVEVVAGEDQDEVALVLDEVEVLAHGVGRALVPVPALQRLLGREQGDEILVEVVEAVGQEDVAVERFAGELGQDEDAAVVRSGCSC